MFNKAKVKRFNEEISCAPPPNKYDPKSSDKPLAYSLSKSDRWLKNKELAPGPGTYSGEIVEDGFKAGPIKAKLGSSYLNSSVSSSNSTSSLNGFCTPRVEPFLRSKSLRMSQTKKVQNEHLKNKIECLEKEKQEMQDSIKDLENKLSLLKVNSKKDFSDSCTQVDLEPESVEILPQSEPEDLSIKKPVSREGDYDVLREQISHLTLLRDNLESSVASKENTIADLRLQIDLVVSDAEQKQAQFAEIEQRAADIEKKLEESLREKETEAIRVKDLVAQYETLMKTHAEMCSSNKDKIAQKDIEIELLNDSICTLNTQVSEYERTVNRIQSEVNLKKFQISSLEVTLGDLSMASKEKEVVESILEDEIQEKNKEVSKLELTLLDVENKLELIRRDRETLVEKLQSEKSQLLVAKSKVDELEVNLKEKEVVQQFLEKEVASREAEVSESNKRVKELEKELETARKVALDLQEEAEVQLHELFCLKASLSATEYDIENKEDMIDSLKKEVCQKSDSLKTIEEVTNELQRKERRVQDLERNIEALKSALDKEEENTNNLEERVVQLMVDLDEREAEHKKVLRNKDTEMEALSLQYSNSLLEEESTKCILKATVESLNKEKLIREASESEADALRVMLSASVAKYAQLETSLSELSLKLYHVEDALACEEAESRAIQKKLETTRSELARVVEENVALTSSLNGYTAQISMLKIDMVKKSTAIEDMQAKIEALRDEKSELHRTKEEAVQETERLRSVAEALETAASEKQSMISDLQNELEAKVKAVTDIEIRLREKEEEILKLETTIQAKLTDEEKQVQAFEEEKAAFFGQISQLEEKIKRENQDKVSCKTKIMELEQKMVLAEQRDSDQLQGLRSELKEEKGKSEDLRTKYNQLQRKYEGYDDQLINLQTSLAEKTAECEKWNRTYLEETTLNESYREKVDELKCDISKLVKESEQLSRSLMSKDALFHSLNDSISVKSEEILSLNNAMEEKQNKLEKMERKLTEMNVAVSTLNEEKERAQNLLFSVQKSLEETKQQLEKRDQLSQQELEDILKAKEIDFQRRISDLNSHYEEILADADTWRVKFETLEKMVEPFREQLEAYEMEKTALMSKSSAAEEEVRKLSEEYARLLGHNNHKQKIQHVVKLKTENSQLKERVFRLQAELEKQKVLIRKLEDVKVNPEFSRSRPPFSASKTNLLSAVADCEDKENSPVLSPNHNNHRTLTPYRSTSLNTKFRRL